MSAVLTQMGPDDGFPPPDSQRAGQVAQLRIPPHSVEAESAVLGSMLLDNSAWDRVGDLLTDSDFYRYEHRLVFAAIGALINATKPADVLTVYEELKTRGHAVEVGGIAYLNSLAQYVSSAHNIRKHAETVRERAIQRKLIHAADEIATKAFNPQGQPVDALLDESMQKVLAISPDVVQDEWVGMDAMVVRLLDDIQERCDNPEAGRGADYIPTGIIDLDAMLDGGVRPGQYIVIGARPSMGKSAMADTMGLHVAMNEGLTVGKFSMEMQNEENVQRAMASVASIPLHQIRRPDQMTDESWPKLTEGVEMLKNVAFFTNDTGGLNINQVRAKARALRSKHGLKLLIVDYIQLMSGVDPRANRNTQLEEASRGLKALAKELRIPVIALAQVNRGVEKEGVTWESQWPRMSDLKDCGSLEQDADIIMFLMRPKVAQPNLGDEWADYAKLRVAKQRGGRTGHVHLQYFGANTRFRDWPEGRQVPSSKVAVNRDKGT
jgi:replicative DNA helicase